MSVAIIGVAGTVISAGVGAYSSYASNKAADKRQKAMMGGGGGGGGFTEFKPPSMPAYIPQNIKDITQQALRQDMTAYQYSDNDFAKRHPGLLQAEKLFEKQTLKDQEGDNELNPAIQNEFMRAGLSSALGAFGDSSGTLAPGSAGEANVAQNLGLSILGFQDRNRQNRQGSLSLAESLFPRRQLGLTGGDISNLLISNNLGTNNWNQADYAARYQTAQQNYLGQAQAANSAQQQSNINAQASAMGGGGGSGQAIAGIASSALGGLAQAYGAYKAGSPTAPQSLSSSVNLSSMPTGVSNLSWRPAGMPV